MAQAFFSLFLIFHWLLSLTQFPSFFFVSFFTSPKKVRLSGNGHQEKNILDMQDNKESGPQ